ncbi:MAG: DUF512 domain-containing protein [Bacillota bacterium]|nr:DUF512 domain-containing protein [Bacillota bacterium]
MKENKGYLVDHVKKNSPAEKAGIRVGWRLLRIDGSVPADIIDYKILEADESLILLMLTDDGRLKRIKIQKAADTSLGMQFDPPTLSEMKRCGNKCIFCFVDQNPKEIRSTVFIKDDDYRLSFLYGNFITLNRLTDAEVDRIIRLRMSPLYVSVHTTNRKLRQLMFGNKLAERGLDVLQKLIDGGIQIHSQIVLCPGFNTGDEMLRTISDLDSMGPAILSVALVPVGLTVHRSGLVKLKKFNGISARTLLEQVEKIQKEYLEKRDSRFVFAADELYMLAGSEIPDEEEYEGFPQLENGIGMARIFLDELNRLSENDLDLRTGEMSVTIITGQSAGPLLKKMADWLTEFKGIRVSLIIATNKYFGEEVTVAGLLTASDLLKAMEGNNPGDVVFISNHLVNEKTSKFLDGVLLKKLEADLGVPVLTARGPKELLSHISKLDFYREKSGGKIN